MQQVDEETIKSLQNMVVEARIANETTFGEIQSSMKNMHNNIKSIFAEQGAIEDIIDNWYSKNHKDNNMTESQAVNIICDVLEKEMVNQMDWFDGLYDLVLNWTNKTVPEYQIYKDTHQGLFPLLRKSDFATTKRIVEEFQRHDFNDMFKFML